ncbi:MAG: TatD family hydrolase [Bacteroidota bacterium]
MLVDTHAHLYLDAFADDIESVIANANRAGVSQILQPAVDLPSIDTALNLCERFEGVYAMAAIHPTSVPEAPRDAMERIRDALAHPSMVAVGESGLDAYWSQAHTDAQIESLRQHARLALSMNLPLIIHNRDQKGEVWTSRTLIRVLREESGGGRLRGVFHCFGGPPWLAAEVMDLGFHIGLGGTLTFKNGGVPDAITSVPLDRIVLETDAPYLAPAPHRGRRNEPAYTRLVAERLAELRGRTFEEIAEITSSTARQLFNLPDPSRPSQKARSQS